MPSIWKAAIHTSYCPSVSCIIFWHWYNLSKKERASKPVPFSFAKIPIKKDMSEFWGLNVTSPMKAGVHTTRGLIHIQREARDSRRPFPSIRWYHVFWARNIKRGVSCPLVVSKRYHICDTKCIFQWYLKKYHICGTKTSIVVSKDTTYVVHFADASKKGLFSDSPFCFLSASAR